MTFCPTTTFLVLRAAAKKNTCTTHRGNINREEVDSNWEEVSSTRRETMAWKKYQERRWQGCGIWQEQRGGLRCQRGLRCQHGRSMNIEDKDAEEVKTRRTTQKKDTEKRTTTQKKLEDNDDAEDKNDAKWVSTEKRTSTTTQKKYQEGWEVRRRRRSWKMEEVLTEERTRTTPNKYQQRQGRRWQHRRSIKKDEKRTTTPRKKYQEGQGQHGRSIEKDDYDATGEEVSTKMMTTPWEKKFQWRRQRRHGRRSFNEDDDYDATEEVSRRMTPPWKKYQQGRRWHGRSFNKDDNDDTEEVSRRMTPQKKYQQGQRRTTQKKYQGRLRQRRSIKSNKKCVFIFGKSLNRFWHKYRNDRWQARRTWPPFDDSLNPTMTITKMMFPPKPPVGRGWSKKVTRIVERRNIEVLYDFADVVVSGPTAVLQLVLIQAPAETSYTCCDACRTTRSADNNNHTTPSLPCRPV